jgi:hypothetical protein
MLTPEEMQALDHAIQVALQVASAGHIDTGYTLLADGLNLARALERHGQPGAALLVERWEQACDEFTAAYGVPPPAPP